MRAGDAVAVVRRPADRRRSRLSPPTILLLAVLVVGLGACSSRDPQPSQPASSDDADPGVVHVHGLGLNPANGEVLAATHTGLFTLPPGGGAVRVADRYQDTMAFTVTGPDQFLGSGHPDLRETDDLIPEGGRPLLGLIQSTDGALSWRPLSLLGKVDFHSLVVAHGLVYGIDSTSGRLLVSADRKVWETRSALPALDLAVSPTDPEVVLAADGSVLLASSDGGRSFVPRPGPPLAYLEWPSASALWGMTQAGQVSLSADGGSTWTTGTALAGEAEAFLATGDGLYVAVVDGGIFRSTDGGVSWQVHYRNGGKVTR